MLSNRHRDRWVYHRDLYRVFLGFDEHTIGANEEDRREGWKGERGDGQTLKLPQ